jgi:hypothetical protein
MRVEADARLSRRFGAFDAATDVLIQPDGKIIAAGSARNVSGGGLGVVRVAP